MLLKFWQRRWRNRTEARLDRRTIGVRCAANPLSLCFHIPFTLASIDASRRPPLRTNQPRGSHNFDDFTFEGEVLVGRVLEQSGVVEVDVRPRYFWVRVSRTDDWPGLLPIIIQLIRLRLGDQRYPLRIKPAFNPRVPSWHAPLMRELFDHLS